MQSWAKHLFKDSLVYGIGYGLSRFLQIIILPIIAQALSLKEFGFYSNYIIFYTFTAGFLVLGLDSAVTRFIFDSEDKKHQQRLFSTALFFILALSLLTISGLFLFPSGIFGFLGIPENYSSALPYVLLSIPAAVLNNFTLSWFKWKRQKSFFLTNSIGSIVLLLVPLLLVERVTFVYIFQVLCFSQLFVAIISCCLALKYIRLQFHRVLLISLLSYGFPWMLVYVFGASRTYLDRVFLTQYLNDDTYGMYNFSVRIASLLSVIITAFDIAFGPLAFSIWNKDGAPLFFARLQSIYIFAISAIACFITIASPLIIQLLGGSKYIGAEKVLPILLFAAIPLSLINFSSLGTVYAKKSFLSTLSLFSGFTVVLVLNFLLTPIYLQYGATTASLIGHLFILFTGYYFSKKYYKISFSFTKDTFSFFFFFLISFLAIHFPLSDHLYLNIALQGSVVIVLILIFLFLFLPVEYKKIMNLGKQMSMQESQKKTGVEVH
jgi:O-antigen/teichoic acid export membrane protein